MTKRIALLALVAMAMAAYAEYDTRQVSPFETAKAEWQAKYDVWVQGGKRGGAPTDWRYYPEVEFTALMMEHEARQQRKPFMRQRWVDAQLKAGATNGPVCVTARTQDGPYTRFSMPVEFRRTGAYKVWLRYYQPSNIYARLSVRFVKPSGETARYLIIDRPDYYQGKVERQFRTGRKGGLVWEPIEMNVEHPGVYTFVANVQHIDSVRGADQGPNLIALNDLWVSDDPKFDPRKGTPKATDVAVEAAPKAPEGFENARHVEPHVTLNSTVKDMQKRMPWMIMECYQHFSDPIARIYLGATDSWKNEKEQSYGFTYTANPDGGRGYPEEKALEKLYPWDARKPGYEYASATNGVGRSGGGGRLWPSWEDSFEPYLAAYSNAADRVAKELMQNDSDLLAYWWTAWEQCGSFDEGPTSQMNYRKWLEKKYGSLDALNHAWHTAYTNFAQIHGTSYHWEYINGEKGVRKTNELERCQYIANFSNFRQFRSEVYAKKIGMKTIAALKNDPKKRHITSNLSCNNLSSVMWLKLRPLSFEDTCRITMAGSDMVGYDNYGTDDLNGANYELFDSFGDGKLRPMIREGSTHTPDPFMLSRMMGSNMAKGMRGMSCFCFMENYSGELSKFGMSNMYDDAAPRPKLAACSDNFRAFNQMGDVLSETARERAVKPVAIYYSSMCNVLQERPYGSIFDCGPDNFFRVYELIHANGYPVTFVTDYQFRHNPEWIDNCAAIFFVDATYIPDDVRAKIYEYVEKGGHIVADAQSGSRNGEGFQTGEFTEWLGVKPVQQEKFDERERAGALAFGYSAYSFDVIQRDALWKTAVEIKETPYSPEHPVFKHLKKVMFSCLGYNEVKIDADDARALLCENNGRPAWVQRQHGKGTSNYFAGFLGTAYGAGCTQYEWSDKHSGPDPYRFIDAILATWGVEKAAVNDLPGWEGLYLRTESPLTDKRGNAVLGQMTQAGGGVRDYRVKYRMPKGAKKPGMVLAQTSSSRELKRVDFKWDDKARTLAVKMPGYRCWGYAYSLVESRPLVSIRPVGPMKRDAYDLPDFRPGDEVKFAVKVFNPSAKKLAAGGKVTLRLTEGWFYDRETAEFGEIAAYGESEEQIFTVKAPIVNAARRVRPINFIYEGAYAKFIGSDMPVASEPAVVMAWFQKEAQEAPAVDFGLE